MIDGVESSRWFCSEQIEASVALLLPGIGVEGGVADC